MQYSTFAEMSEAKASLDAELCHNSSCQRQRMDGLAGALWRPTDTSNNDADTSVRFHDQLSSPD